LWFIKIVEKINGSQGYGKGDDIMGLDFSYLLYFKREHLWEALQGVAGIAEPYHPPIRIHFPDHELSIPLDSWVLKDKEVHHDDPEFSFATALIFEEDEAIEDYLFGLGIEYTYRSPPGTDDGNRVSIGYIYLTVYNDLSWLYPQKKQQMTWSCSILEPPEHV
jgi:hypothetical protein